MLNNIVHKTAHVVRIVVNLDVCWFIRDHQLKVMTKTSSTGARGKNPFRTPRPMIDVGVVSLLFLIISITKSTKSSTWGSNSLCNVIIGCCLN